MASVTEFDGFYGAVQARKIALGQASGTNEILREINAIQEGIDTEAASGNLILEITGTTTMTNSEDYFNSWNDPFNYDTPADKLRRAAMNQVINYFSRLGYNVKRVRRNNDNFFDWKILW